MSPAQLGHDLDRASPSTDDTGGNGGGQGHENKKRMKSQSQRRQSAPSLVLTKALTRSRTISRESFQVPMCPETCPLIQSYLACSDRSFLLYGHAQLKTGLQTQERHLFLFSDALLVTKANSSEEKEKWLRIKEEKEREEPKTIALNVQAKGINTFAHTKTLPVSNSDSTNEVIRLALQQFGIADYQLWVISKRDTPYPLIGHEFPFSIHAHHTRHAPSRDALTSTDRQEALQPSRGKHCQFMLKLRAIATAHRRASIESSHKPFKRQRSLINLINFWKGSSSQLNHPSPCHLGNGCLFGQPLSCLCTEDMLPKPIMLRDSLDAGLGDLPLTHGHVFIIAGVFKPAVLIGRLPVANGLLLRYVAALLRGIQGNAHHNQMTSFNLSVCIAPSMLWAPGPSSPQQEGRGAKMVCDLVRFIIDHCQQVIGEEPSSLFGGPPQRHSDEDTPSAESCQMTDSSYDSLENELDDCSSDGSPSLTRHRRHPPYRPYRSHGYLLRGSMDSILTLSDLEPDGADAATADPDHASGGTAASRDPRSPCHGQRRSSEPIMMCVSKLAVCHAPLGSPSPQAPPRSPLQTQGSGTRTTPTHHRSTGSLYLPRTPGGPAPHTGSDIAVSYRQPGTTLSLFRRPWSGQMATAETAAPPAALGSRRSSEPQTPTHHHHQGVETPTATAAAATAPGASDPGLNVSEANPKGVPREDQTRFCLPPGVPAATWENRQPQSGPQVALALVRGRGQWRRTRRHSSVLAERDFSQLLFSEESHV
ncbi:hypothetical protein NHX12_015309 [Muraenolepis orangiensis]|uniref:Ras-associating domain-containing protein n=1 Tax=Muraenolepis orangiensis TaxID=630683 RepID=A0A9Q0I3R4_9TELE|nr:hypothetical protein NHX12_015309 [Muraenolepis orangiensis]